MSAVPGAPTSPLFTGPTTTNRTSALDAVDRSDRYDVVADEDRRKEYDGAVDVATIDIQP